VIALHAARFAAQAANASLPLEGDALEMIEQRWAIRPMTRQTSSATFFVIVCNAASTFSARIHFTVGRLSDPSATVVFRSMVEG